jgi:hypothetical protein
MCVLLLCVSRCYCVSRRCSHLAAVDASSMPPQVGDYSSMRFLSTMWRLNMSAVFLLLTLDNTYVLYYIVPLHTVYFLLVYFVMKARRHFSARSWVALAVTFGAIYTIVRTSRVCAVLLLLLLLLCYADLYFAVALCLSC